MGDQYPPPHRYGGDRYDDRYNDRYDDRYDNRYADRYDGRRDDRYDARYDDRREPSNYYDQRPAGGYTFRGAAGPEPYRAPPDFTFRTGGPPAPRFPPSDYYAPQPPPQSRSRRNDERVRGDRRHPPPGQRGGAARGNARRGGFKTRAAHTRDILRNTHRETTPEQLEGMSAGGQTRFKEVESDSDDDGVKIVDLTYSSDDEEAAGSRKRIRRNGPPESAVPKWSNPDPYTVLPPPETLGAPKKDIVQVIRKAKVEAATGADAKKAANEADFISLNFDDDFDEDMDAEIDNRPPPNAPRGPSSGFTAINASNSPPPPPPPDDALGGPLAPPPGFVMPTDEELMEQMRDRGGSKKRKRAYRSARGADDVLDEWQADDHESTPWCDVDHSETSSSAFRLHKEIGDFYDFVRPYDYEETARRDLIGRILQATRASPTTNARSADIQCFGSFAAGLYLPTADMDLVAVSPDYLRQGYKSYCQSKKQMWNLAHHLEKVGLAPPSGVVVIAKAKVPIIKFVDKRTSIKVDISFENDSGLRANKTFQEWKEQFPEMPVIVVLVKQLLAMRGLNEVFTGGIGGFTIICLVVSMMQHMPELQSDEMQSDTLYSDLLLNFLDFYGNRFDVRQTGIIMNPPGYFDKIRNPRSSQNANRLTIIDPNRPDNDISGGSSQIDKVFACFRRAHSKIQDRIGEWREGEEVEESILGCVLGGNYSSFIHQREKLSLLHHGYAAPPPPPPAPLPKRQQPPPRTTRSQTATNPPPPPPPPKQRGQGVAHPLPSKPTGSDRKKGKVTTGPLDQPETLEAPDAAVIKQPKKKRNKGSSTKAEKKVLLENRRKKKADKFKKKHPGVPDVPDSMSHGEVRKLNEKLGAPKKLSKGQKHEDRRQHATAFKKRFPHITGVPDMITNSQMCGLCMEHGIESKGLWKKLRNG